MKVLLVLLFAWVLMTPRGPIMHEERVVRFDTQASCAEMADWLNGQIGRDWFSCIRWF